MTDTKPGFWSRKRLFGASIGMALFFMLVGIIFWGGFNTAMEATNTMEFCITCHEMEENVYQEYQGTIHDANRSGVRATCSDCHVPKSWGHKMIRKIQASKEVWHKMLGSIDTPEKFDGKRLHLAKNVWHSMKSTDSRECRNCHDFDTMDPAKQKPRARKQHMNAMRQGMTCIDCHKGIAHKKVHDQLEDEELEQMTQPDPSLIREVPQRWLDFEKQEAEREQAEKVAAKAKREQRAAEKKLAAEQAAAKAAEAAATQATTASTENTEKAATPDASGISWDVAPSREVGLFYPGQSSMEWTLVGKYHGGARPFKAGDRCFDCHDKETQAMGEKIVTGAKEDLEPNLIPGKRGSIPLTVQALYDEQYLYMHFQWPDTEHAPAPFVEGGKMDPENPTKLAIMLSSDEINEDENPAIKYTRQAGCWGTCHHDARDMPTHPDAESLSASAHAQTLDFSQGVTKYISESRTKIEEKGRRGKKLGGWDKLKDGEALKAEMDAGHVMDLLRFKSGKGETEDGHILEQRVMTGGQGFEATAALANGTWTLEIKRKLVSTQPGDLSLTKDKLYNIGFAVHDDYSDARYHHVSLGYKLGFDNDEAEINAVAK
ncbi:NapC/NirT family cytochrome c [Candidatus Venteria ishoeyi]|uniref:NapC/NirT family cytochrome c n=1 Tax=Candidatus Venteria ishoeyi TaxID=1899563 RepID=UPI0025A5B568|nr:NapC/NirT family cytochrome c [Candidatus Venteria ishoeyi]MDM8546122.1 NapC/NirT family cytochrome c [Candidatus Venteria ishoeyi]